MKSIFLLLITCILYSGISAQTNTGILQIQLDTKQLSGTCTLAGVDTVYMHSGLGWSNPDSLWETIVGNWGIPDGKGLMTNMGNGVFSICFNVVDYYTNQADPDSTHPGGVGYGPMPQGATPYNIGAVFRTASCPVSLTTGKPECAAAKTGKDENCENILIIGINDPVNMSVQDYTGTPFGALTATYITQCAGVVSGVESIALGLSNMEVFPTPFTDAVHLQFNLQANASPKAEIFDMLGQKVADLSGSIKNGQNYLTWNGKDFAGKTVTSGVYVYRITNNNQAYSGKIIKE